MTAEGSTLQNALAALKQKYGDQLKGPRRQTEARMRHTLQEQMGLNEFDADRLLIRLRDNGQLVYIGRAEVGTEPGTSTTGPVISMPSTATSGGEPIITTASPAAVMGVVDSGRDDLGANTEDEEGRGVDASLVDMSSSGPPITGAGAVSTDPIRGGDPGYKVAENREGSTMGELGDTSVEAAPAPITRGEHEEVDSDRTEGYWRIG